MKHLNEISEPYEFEKENPTTGQVEIIKKLSDCVSSEKSLLKLVNIFLANKDRIGTGNDDIIDEDEDQAVNESGIACGKDNDEVVESESEGDGACEALNSEL